MIVRLSDWNARLNDALALARDREFSWGSNDCCHFVGDVVLAMTGVDPLVDYRGTYASEADAWAALNARDGSLRAACRRVFGGAVKASFARRGDVVLLRGGMAIGICMGPRSAFVSDDGAGLVWRPASDCTFAFPLGWPE